MDSPTLPARYNDARKSNPDPLGLSHKIEDSGRDNKSKVSKSVAFADAVIITVVVVAGSLAAGLLLSEWILRLWDSYQESQDPVAHTKYPNPFGFQYVLPDKGRPVIEVEPGRLIRQDFNVGVEMNSKSFSAHSPIKVHVEVRMLRENVPEHWVVFDKMHVVFVGSHNIPIKYTGLGKGYYPGYIEAIEQSSDTAFLHYKGDGYIQFEMGGQYPVYLSSVRPAIEPYDATLISAWPTVSIAAEDATNAVREAEETESRDRVDLALTLAILAASFAAIRQPVKEMINDLSARPASKSSQTGSQERRWWRRLRRR